MRGVWMIGVVVTAALLSGCGDPDAAGPLELMGENMLYHVNIEANPSPPVADDVVLDVMLMDHATMEGVPGATLTVEPWMTAHNHGVDGDPKVSDDGNGAYTVEFAFSMPGSWEVRIDIDGTSGADRVVAEYEVE